MNRNVFITSNKSEHQVQLQSEPRWDPQGGPECAISMDSPDQIFVGIYS